MRLQSTASMISLSPGFCRRRVGGSCRRSFIWWLFRLNRFLDVHRTNNVAQHVGKCDDSQQSTLFTALSFFLLEAYRSINGYIEDKQESKLQTSPSTTTRRCTRRFLISCRSVPIESEAVQITTPGKSGERWFRASAIVKSRDWYAPRRTRVCTSDRFKIDSIAQGRILTMTSTVSYKLTTTPFSSIMGTAEMPRSENM